MKTKVLAILLVAVLVAFSFVLSFSAPKHVQAFDVETVEPDTGCNTRACLTPIPTVCDRWGCR